MIQTKAEFKKRFEEVVKRYIGEHTNNISEYECYIALCMLVKSQGKEIHAQKRELINRNEMKDIYYFSMEFLIGKLLKTYLINLGIRDIVEDGLKELGYDLDKVCELERDPGLGNGGLGRLAACFMDSLASLGINAMGMGVRYRFGLFKQKIVDGEQIEVADNWLDKGYPWEDKRDDRAVKIKFGGYVDREYENDKMSYKYKGYEEILAVPYDVPIIGYDGALINVLRLWYAQPLEEKFDLTAFNEGNYSKAVDYRNRIEAISSILYPDDTNTVGKQLRLQQEYLLVSAGIQDIVSRYKRKHGENNWKEFSKYVAIHINDTHPTMCIPELMRVLLDDEKLEWDEAYDITIKTISYTNHTVLPEALERWPIHLMKEQLPRIYMIIEEISRRYEEKFDKHDEHQKQLLKETAILWDNNVYMANLSTICSYSVNGVAALHTDILKKETLRAFYELTPEKFNNKTNGVSHRRFLVSANKDLTNLIKKAIGDSFITNPNDLEKLLQFQDDKKFLTDLAKVKHNNKIRLANYIKEHNGIIVDPDSVFDIQIKRIHAYKRQLLNVFRIMNLYNEIKDGTIKDIIPQTFIFAGKAAGSYTFAKKTIKLINDLAKIVNEDEQVNKFMKVVFIENFCVSNGEIIYPAAEVSEQISTAGKEASGTGNMKFMFNGAITLGTLDGANVEIHSLVGDDNIFIFGNRAEQIASMREDNSYNPKEVSKKDKRLEKIKEQLVHGININREKTNFWDIYDSIWTYGDEYFVLADFDDYVKKSFDLLELYKNKTEFNKKSLINIAKAGFFSSDRTIKEYFDDIWSKY